MRFPRLGHGSNHQFNIPPELPHKCPKIHTLFWVASPSHANDFDLTPIPKMPNLRSLSLTNLPILFNNDFYLHVVGGCPKLTTLSLTLPHSFQSTGLQPFAPLQSLHTLEMYNCSYNLAPLELHSLPHLNSVIFHNSTYDSDFETIDLLTRLPLEKLEVKFLSSLRSAQLKERLIYAMSAKRDYKLACRGNLYDTFCYSLTKQ